MIITEGIVGPQQLALLAARVPITLIAAYPGGLHAGERACSRLLERIADPTLPPQAERLPTELIIRESCGCGPSPARAPGHGQDATRAAPGRHDLALSPHHLHIDPAHFLPSRSRFLALADAP
jgi:hypothetical protein